jgi:hypothetical protein
MSLLICYGCIVYVGMMTWDAAQWIQRGIQNGFIIVYGRIEGGIGASM